MTKRKFQITFRRYTDFNCTIEATTHATAKMQVAYSLLRCGYFKKFGDVIREIDTCRALEPLKRGRK